MAGLRGPPEHPADSHGRQHTHPGDGGLADHGGRALKGHREGPGPHPMGNCCMSAGEVDASATLGLEDNPPRWSGCWRSCCGSSSTRPSSSTPLTCRSPLGGVAAMLAPRTKDWHLWEDGAPTKWSQKRRRCTGSTSRSTWKSTRGHSRMGIPSGGLRLWKCWARSSSVT